MLKKSVSICSVIFWCTLLLNLPGNMKIVTGDTMSFTQQMVVNQTVSGNLTNITQELVGNITSETSHESTTEHPKIIERGDPLAGLLHGRDHYKKGGDTMNLFIPLTVVFCTFLCFPWTCVYIIVKNCYKKVTCLRIFSLCFNILFWSFIFIGTSCTFQTSCWRHHQLVDYLRVLTLFSLPLLWIVMIIDSLKCPEREYLSNMKSLEDTQQYLTNLKQTRPRVGWEVECFHTNQHKNGGRRKVVTYCENATFKFNHSVDSSEWSIMGLSDVGVTLVEVNVTIVAGDEDTSRAIETAKQRIESENRERDVYMTLRDKRQIRGLNRRIAVSMGKSPSRFVLGLPQFWITSVLGITWIYRGLFTFVTSKTQYTVKKQIYVRKGKGRSYEIKNGVIPGQVEIPIDVC